MADDWLLALSEAPDWSALPFSRLHPIPLEVPFVCRSACLRMLTGRLDLVD